MEFVEALHRSPRRLTTLPRATKGRSNGNAPRKRAPEQRRQDRILGEVPKFADRHVDGSNRRERDVRVRANAEMEPKKRDVSSAESTSVRSRRKIKIIQAITGTHFTDEVSRRKCSKGFL